MIRILLTSILLHLALLCLGLLLIRPHAPRPPDIRSAPIAIEVESAKPGTGKVSGGAKRGSPKKALPKSPSLSELGVFSHGGLPSIENPEGTSGAGPQSPYAFESQLTSKASPLLTYLFRRIDG